MNWFLAEGKITAEELSKKHVMSRDDCLNNKSAVCLFTWLMLQPIYWILLTPS